MLLRDLCAVVVAAASMPSFIQALPLTVDTGDVGISASPDSLSTKLDILRNDSSLIDVNATNNASDITDQGALFTWPSFRQFPDKTKLDKIKEAYKDSFVFATAGSFVSAKKETYKRYFRPQDELFVTHVWDSLFSPNQGIGAKLPAELFSQMIVWYGVPPNWHDDCANNPQLLGVFYQNFADPDEWVNLIICARSLQLPVLKNVHCKDIHNHVDNSFDSLGGTMLHEYMHWAKLMRSALDTKHPAPRTIEDYRGPDPPNGYGPFNAMQVKKKRDPTENADNFKWLALESYWTGRCNPKPPYGEGRDGEPMCDLNGRTDLAEDCHPG